MEARMRGGGRRWWSRLGLLSHCDQGLVVGCAHGTQIFGSGTGAVGTAMNQAATGQHRGRLGKGILGGTTHGEQFLEPQAEPTSHDLELLVERRLTFAALGAGIARPLHGDTSEYGGDGRRPHPLIVGHLSVRTDHIWAWAAWRSQGEERLTGVCNDRVELTKCTSHRHDEGVKPTISQGARCAPHGNCIKYRNS
jgi:hypothetical protein